MFPAPKELSTWYEVLDALELFPAPRIGFDQEGDLSETAWVFRGASDASFELEPSIERSANGAGIDWAPLEISVSAEFKSRVRNHLAILPAADDEVGWLALMQHYRVPTRLLDFTMSPFVALYFAVRQVSQRPARVWAIDSQAIIRNCRRVLGQANKADRDRHEPDQTPKYFVDFSSDSFATGRDQMARRVMEIQEPVRRILSATGTLRAELLKLGCVSMALPSTLNPRLSNQQGLFLFNGAEDRLFADSLKAMMANEKTNWYQAFDIPASLRSEIESRLYQMNIQEQSLFPDLEGLSGLIKQRIRMHWGHTQ